jgi:hypothetical protein
MNEHTPTPWRAVIYGNSEWEVWGGDLLVADVTTPEDPLQPEVAEANAAFIVRAVNSHEALVAALKSVEWVWFDNDNKWRRLCPHCKRWDGDGHAPDCQLDTALRAAEGEILEDEDEGELTPFGKALIGREPLPKDAGQTYETTELSKPD